MITHCLINFGQHYPKQEKWKQAVGVLNHVNNSYCQAVTSIYGFGDHGNCFG